MSSRVTIGAAEAIEARRGTALRIVFFIVKKIETVGVMKSDEVE